MFSVIIFLTVILTILYTALNPGLYSAIGLSLWVFISSIPIISLIQKRKKWTKKELGVVVVMILILFFHYYFTTDSLLSLFMYLIALITLLQLSKSFFNAKLILLIPIVGVLLQTIIFFPSLKVSLTASNDILAFQGFFLNSNTCSIFASIAYICSFYLLKNKTRYLFMFICVVNMLGGMSRNAFLFVIIFHLFLYLQLRFKYDKVLLYIIPVILFFMGYVLLFVDTSSLFSFFGKGGSTGRSLQIIYLFKTYDINLLGYGRDFISGVSLNLFGYSPHNMLFYTLYGMGVLFLFVYVRFVVLLYSYFISPVAKSALLAMQIYYFFEPVIPFEVSMSFLLPILTFISIDRYSKHKSCQELQCVAT